MADIIINGSSSNVAQQLYQLNQTIGFVTVMSIITMIVSIVILICIGADRRNEK